MKFGSVEIQFNLLHKQINIAAAALAAPLDEFLVRAANWTEIVLHSRN